MIRLTDNEYGKPLSENTGVTEYFRFPSVDFYIPFQPKNGLIKILSDAFGIRKEKKTQKKTYPKSVIKDKAETKDLQKKESENIIISLNKKVADYKKKYKNIKIGLTDKDPGSILQEIKKKERNWEHIQTILTIKSLYIYHIIEFWLIDEHWDIFDDIKITSDYHLLFNNEKYLYLLTE